MDTASPKALLDIWFHVFPEDHTVQGWSMGRRHVGGLLDNVQLVNLGIHAEVTLALWPDQQYSSRIMMRSKFEVFTLSRNIPTSTRSSICGHRWRNESEPPYRICCQHLDTMTIWGRRPLSSMVVCCWVYLYTLGWMQYLLGMHDADFGSQCDNCVLLLSQNANGLITTPTTSFYFR